MPPCTPGTRYTGCCPGSSPSASPRRPSCRALLLDVAEEHFRLRDVRVGIADTRGEVVRDIAGHDARIAPVPRQTDLVDQPPIHEERLEPLRDEGPHLDRAPRAAHDHRVSALDSLASGE